MTGLETPFARRLWRPWGLLTAFRSQKPHAKSMIAIPTLSKD
jgi:hypothetical protein